MLPQTVILSGGYGTRVKRISHGLPKSMLPIGEKPFLEILIDWLIQQGVRRILLSTAYMSEAIARHFNNKSALRATIAFSEESEPMGTGGFLVNAPDLLEDEILVVNGDTLFDINLGEFCENSRRSGFQLCMALHGMRQTERYGNVLISPNNRILSFDEKSKTPSGLINGGIYYFGDVKKMYNDLNLHARTCLSLERELFPAMVRDGTIGGFVFNSCFFVDIGTETSYERSLKAIPKWLEVN